MQSVSSKTDIKLGDEPEQVLSAASASALGEVAQDEVYGLNINTGTISSRFDLNSYFGGLDMPLYALVYKFFLKDYESVPILRWARSIL